MARRFILSDDLTGKESDDVQTHLCMFDNVFYEVDFSADSFAKFEVALAPFRKVMRETRRITATAKGEASKGEVIRQWAKDNGYEIGDRGRISDDIVEAYDKAHSDASATGQDSSEQASDSAPGSAPDSPQNGENADSVKAEKAPTKAAK